MIGTSLGAVYEGLEGTVVRVEVDVTNGLPQFSIVGLPDSAVSESKLRIRSAIRNAGLEFPNKRITVNLSPASLKKRGAGLDLAIAVSILRASHQIPNDTADAFGFSAELSLSGALVPVSSLVTLALAFKQQSVRYIAIAEHQFGNCVPIPNVEWVPCASLLDVVQTLRDPHVGTRTDTLPVQPFYACQTTMDFTDVHGLGAVKRALTIAAAGRHHVMLVGPPGCGKTMLGERLPSILPHLSELEALEVYAIHQSCGDSAVPSLIPPLRIPHHTLSAAGMVGGGSRPVPGEITLAHRGVLLLDEVLEFRRSALDALREPIVQKHVRLSRSGHAVTFPADFLLVGTLNPCPCGKRGFGDCTCLASAISRYWNHISGALMDRIDMLIHVHPQSWDVPTQSAEPLPEGSADIRQCVTSASGVLKTGAATLQSGALTVQPSDFQASAWKWMRQAVHQIRLSGRAAASVQSMSRTIAALDGRDTVADGDVSEAIAMRPPTTQAFRA